MREVEELRVTTPETNSENGHSHEHLAILVKNQTEKF